MEEVKVVLVDKNDSETGLMNKTEAHLKGVLHRAVSVFIFDTQGKWLLQQRSLNKYHSAGLWTNTCCSHPFPGESHADAAARRLKEEMGIENCILTKLFDFTYYEKLENGLIEHEFDHVYAGFTSQEPDPNTKEVMEYKYVSFDELKTNVDANPELFTIWFRHIFERVQQYLISKDF